MLLRGGFAGAQTEGLSAHLCWCGGGMGTLTQTSCLARYDGAPLRGHA
jgi:hypothetical protein